MLERFTVDHMPVAADARHGATGGARAGRPRDPQVDASIRAATLELLVEDGYQATTIQAVARRAGVSAPSIYRRWSSKAQLVEAAVFPSDLVEPTSGREDVSEELADYCGRILSYLAQPPVRAAIPGLLSEYQTDPQMYQRLTARTLAPMRRSFEAFLRETGSDDPPSSGVSVDALFEVMMGALFARALNVGAEGADDFAHQVALVATSALAMQPRKRRRPFERAR